MGLRGNFQLFTTLYHLDNDVLTACPQKHLPQAFATIYEYAHGKHLIEISQGLLGVWSDFRLSASVYHHMMPGMHKCIIQQRQNKEQART